MIKTENSIIILIIDEQMRDVVSTIRRNGVKIINVHPYGKPNTSSFTRSNLKQRAKRG